METPDLPNEILVEIFQYIDDLDDFKSITLVCKSWLEATQTPKISKNLRLCFSCVTLKDVSSYPLNCFSHRRFSNIHFENTKFQVLDDGFWSRLGSGVTDITFHYKAGCDPGLNLVRLLKYFPYLKTLGIIDCANLFERLLGELEGTEQDAIFSNLQQVKELNLYFGEKCMEKFFSGWWIERLKAVSNIDFDINSKKVKVSPEAYEKVYEFVERYGRVIKGIHVCDNNRATDKRLLEVLIASQVKLKAFDIIIKSTTKKLCQEFLQKQDKLEFLTINGSFSYSNLDYLPKLKEIAIANAGPIESFEVFSEKKLASLGVAGLEFYTERPNTDFKANRNLKELYLIDPTVELTRSFMEKICESFENMRLLNIEGSIIDDSSFRCVFALKKLEELKISRTEISDLGITGSSSKKPQSSRKRPRLDSSDSEEDLLEGSLSDLENLTVLNIDFCKRISNKSLKQGLSFKKLKHFSAQGCNSFNVSGISVFLKSNPLLESVNFNRCSGINDACVGVISKKLSHLETLEVSGCPGVSDAAVELLSSHCKKLQTLDISKCSVDIEKMAPGMFEKIQSLRRIIVDKESKLYRSDFV